MFLYAAGTVQGFIDSTQLSLLRLYVFLGIFLSAASVWGMILELRRLFKAKTLRFLFQAVIYLFFVFFGSATVFAAMFIITISGGNAGP